METLRFFAIVAIIWTVGFFTAPLSILERVVYLTPDFWDKPSCVKPSLARYFLILPPMLWVVCIFFKVLLVSRYNQFLQ